WPPEKTFPTTRTRLLEKMLPPARTLPAVAIRAMPVPAGMTVPEEAAPVLVEMLPVVSRAQVRAEMTVPGERPVAQRTMTTVLAEVSTQSPLAECGLSATTQSRDRLVCPRGVPVRTPLL